jgi:hypothetical protein
MKILSLLFMLSLSFNYAFGATFMSTITKSFGKTSGCSSDQSVKSTDEQTKKNNLTFKGSKKEKSYR